MGQPYETNQKKQHVLSFPKQRVKRSKKQIEEIRRAKKTLKEMYGADAVTRVITLPNGSVRVILISKDKRQQRAEIRIQK